MGRGYAIDLLEKENKVCFGGGGFRGVAIRGDLELPRVMFYHKKLNDNNKIQI